MEDAPEDEKVWNWTDYVAMAKVTGLPDRVRVLIDGAELTSNARNKEYGEPVKNMSDIAKLWSEYMYIKYGVAIELMPEDVPHMMTLMKIVRSAHQTKRDNFVDAATYQAIAYECAVDREEQNEDD